MRGLLDVNALIALFDEDHPFNSAIRKWWVGNRAAGWASCPLTENGFLRVVSQPRYSSSMSLAEAFGLFDFAIEHGNHAFWPDDLSLADRLYIDRRYVVGPKQLTDIYLLALAVKHGGRLVSFGRTIPLAAVRQATPDHLVIL
jgi:hypothetical protein